MLDSVRGYVYERRWRLVKAASVAGGVYVCGRYMLSRLKDAREAVMQEKQARDCLRRRFLQNREDTTYTIMALVPTLGEQILLEMDVEGITQELQSRSRQRTQLSPPRNLAIPRAPASAPSESSVASSIDPALEHETRSDAGSIAQSFSSISERPHGPDDAHESSSGGIDESTLSWVDQLSVSNSSLSPSSPTQQVLPASPALSQYMPLRETTTSPTQELESAAGLNLSDSMMTASSAVISAIGDNASSVSEPTPSARSVVHSERDFTSCLATRSKAELWKEVKMLTFTRTLTILYSTTLLSLFTTVQLAILGRQKYVQATLEQSKTEQIMAPPSGGLDDILRALSREVEGEQAREEAISEEVEMVYLTLSWWLLHVGWKDVGERVRRGVEDVFDAVSLKTKVGPMDLHRLFNDVRRRVEYEITFEGRERRTDFISALLPPTAETLHHVLIQGGAPPGGTNVPAFHSLLEETRAILSSPEFARVLEVALDRAMSILFEGLGKNVFVESGVSADSPGAGEVKLRLAGLLPGLARWGHLACSGLPNELVEGIMGMREAGALSAIIFAKFEERFR